MTTAFKPNPGLNPAALPEWRKMVRAVNELERHKVVLSGKVAAQSRTLGNTIGATAQALADIGPVSFDARLGNAPTALGAVATGYFDAATGNPSAQVVLTWTAPTAYADGSTFTASGYEVWRALSGGEWQLVTYVTGPSATLVRQPFGGAAYQYEVRAQSADNGLYGAFSSPVSVTPPSTLPALPAPDVPSLATSLGIITATWDGLLGGATPPPGFRGVYAEVSTDGGTTWSQAGQNLLVGGTGTALGPFNDGQAVSVRLRAIDATSQATAASAVVSIAVVGVTGPQIVANSITTAQIKAGQITSALINTTGLTGITVTGSTIQTSATASRGIKLSGTTLTAYDGSGNATLTVDGSTGAITTVGLNATTATISGAITATSGAITGTMTVSGTLATGTTGARVAITSAGLAGYNAAGTQTFSFLTSSGVVTATGGTFTNITVTGTSTFSGSLSGASGTFAGSLTAASGTISGTLSIGGSGKVSVSRTSGGNSNTAVMDVNGFTATAHSPSVNVAGTIFPAIDRTLVMDGNVFSISESGHTQIVMASAGNDTGGSISAFSSTAGNGTLILQGGVNTMLTLSDDGNPRISSDAIMNRNYVVASASPGTGGSSSTSMGVVTSGSTLGVLQGRLQLPDVYTRVNSVRAVFVSSNGDMGTAASSRRVKKNLKRLRWDDDTVAKWLAIKPYEFEYKGEAAEGNPGIHHGFVAEDVHDAGFTKMVYYDEREGEHKGRIDGFAYERMGVYDHLALGRLYDDLMSLRQRVADLEGSR